MASQWKRNINLYINVNGEQLKNDVKSIRAELQHVINAQAKMTIGSDEYLAATKKIQALSGILKQHKQDIGQLQTPLQKVTDFAKGLLPAFGFGLLASGAKFLFDKIVSGTDAMADKWEFAMAGMKNGLNYFYKTLSSGDWSNFLTNMREAVKVGTEYAKMLDHAEDSTRALSMVESDARREELRLELAIKNKTLSKAERIKAGEDRVKLEEDLSAKRTKIAQEELDAELLIASQRTGLSKEQLISISKDIDSQSKLEAEAYQGKIARLNELRSKNVTPVTEATSGYVSYISRPDTPEITSLSKEIESTPDSIKKYAGALDQYGNLTVDMMDKIAQAYAKKNEAEDSAVENTKKVRTMVNSLLSGQEEDGSKIEDQADKRRKESADKAIEILDNVQNQRNAKIIDQYEKEAQSQEWFQEQQLAAEMAYLVQKKAILEQFGQSTVDVENQINQKRIEAQNRITEARAEALKNEAEINKIAADEALNFSEQSDKETEDLVNESIRNVEQSLKDQAATEQQILDQRAQAYLNFATMVGGSLGDLMNDSEATFSDYLNTILVMSLDALHQFFLLKKAEVWIDAAAGAATGRFWKIAGAVAAVVAMEAAYQGIRGSLGPKKHAAGGYTEGETTYIAGEAGTEWIAPNWMLQNPVTSEIIQGMENWRKNPVTVSTAAFNATMPLNSSGAFGYSSPSSQPSIASVPASPQFSDASLARWENIVSRFEQMEWNLNLTELDKIQNRRAIREKQSKL